MDCTIYTISNSQLICSHTQGNIFTLFYGANSINSCYKNMAIDASANFKYLYIWIYVDIAIFTVYNIHLTWVSNMIIYFLTAFYGDTFIKVIQIINAFMRFNHKQKIIYPFYYFIHVYLLTAIWCSCWNVEELRKLRYVFEPVVFLAACFRFCLVFDWLSITSDHFKQNS